MRLKGRLCNLQCQINLLVRCAVAVGPSSHSQHVPCICTFPSIPDIEQ